MHRQHLFLCVHLHPYTSVCRSNYKIPNPCDSIHAIVCTLCEWSQVWKPSVLFYFSLALLQPPKAHRELPLIKAVWWLLVTVKHTCTNIHFHTHTQPVVLSIMSSYCECEATKYLLQWVLQAKNRSVLHLGFNGKTSAVQNCVCMCLCLFWVSLHMCISVLCLWHLHTSVCLK